MSYQQLKKKTDGFTIIEVLIVLAIAGLIMLIVFLAVPALQRNSRNNSRNNDASRISSLVTECLANRNGDIDRCKSEDQINFDENAFSIIENVDINTSNQPNNFGDESTVVVNYDSVCVAGGGESKADGTSRRQFTVAYVAEPDTKRCIGSE